MLLVLACNPFGGDGDEVAADSEELVDVNFERPASDRPEGEQQVQPAQEEAPADEDSSQPVEALAEPAPEPPPSPEAVESAEAPMEAPMDAPTEVPAVRSPGEASAAEALDLVWAYLSQCISLTPSELEVQQINDQWFVQAAGESPDMYGIWTVDTAVGLVTPHNIRARQWAPQINSSCSHDAFVGFYVPTPAPQFGGGVSDAEQAVTSLWATLVKCYPTVQVENLQATSNPAKGEWVVTGTPGSTTNYGVWAVRSNGQVLPHNRQAQGIYDQLDSGLC